MEKIEITLHEEDEEKSLITFIKKMYIKGILKVSYNEDTAIIIVEILNPVITKEEFLNSLKIARTITGISFSIIN